MRALLDAARSHRDVHVSRGPVFDPAITTTMLCLIFASLVGIGVWLAIALVTAKADGRRREQAACDLAAKTLIREKPLLANTVELVDRCHYLRRLRGDEP